MAGPAAGVEGAADGTEARAAAICGTVPPSTRSSFTTASPAMAAKAKGSSRGGRSHSIALRAGG